MKAMAAAGTIRPTVLHYTGYVSDQGGIMAVVRALAGESRFACVLGVSRGFVARADNELEVHAFTPMEGERIDARNLWRARKVALEVRAWLRADMGRVFHGHSRAGLLVALWLAWMGERRCVVSVHCYGRQRWFYRRAAQMLGERLFWLSPAMSEYYGVPTDSWERCIPGGVRRSVVTAVSPVAPDRWRLGGIGALVRWKRWDLVLRALALLPEPVRRRIRFEHIGAPGGDEDSRAFAAEIAEETRRSGLAESVVWRGREPSSARLLGDIDVLLVLSDHEPFSMALLEALAAGVPVIAANTGGARDIIRHGENGWLFRSGDAGALAELLTQITTNDGRPKMSREAIAGTAVYASDVARRWAGVYERLLAGQLPESGGK